MSAKSKLLIAESFKITSKKVKELTDEKIITLSNCKVLDYEGNVLSEEGHNLSVLRHSIDEKPGEYSVLIGLKNNNEVIDEIEIKAIIKSSKKLLALLLSLIALIVLLGGMWWFNKNTSNTTASGLPISATEKMSSAEIKKYAENVVDKSNVTLQVYPKVKIQSDGKTGKMFIQNVPSNETGQVATLKEKDTGEVLYTSDLLEPKYQVSDIKLKKKLSKGTHKGIVTITFYDLKEKKQIGRSNVQVTITVS